LSPTTRRLHPRTIDDPGTAAGDDKETGVTPRVLSTHRQLPGGGFDRLADRFELVRPAYITVDNNMDVLSGRPARHPVPGTPIRFDATEVPA
jgi:hypothetical protein